MELFAHNDEVVRLETALPMHKGAARLPLLLSLAWYVRQSDSHRAQSILNEIPLLLDQLSLSLPERRRIDARMQLVLAEIKWLQTSLAEAVNLAETALYHFAELKDYQGCADAHWVLGAIAIDQGDATKRNQERYACAEAARAANDMDRVEIAEAAIACSEALRDGKAAERRWGERFSSQLRSQTVAAKVWGQDFLAIIAESHCDFGTACSHWMESYEAALATGQIRRAIATATNIGDAFNSLNEHHGALDWMQRGLDLARQYAWSGNLGICLAQTGETLRRLKRFAAAEELLQEAVKVMQPLIGSRNYATVLAYIAELKLDQQQYQEALARFEEFLQRARDLKQADFQTMALRGMAHALLELGRAAEAQQAANSALVLAEQSQDHVRQIEALQVLADIHARHELPPPEAMQTDSAALHYLGMARNISQNIPGYRMNGDLFDAMGREYSRLRQFEAAYQFAMLAREARAATQTEEANHRAVALQVQQQTERTRAEMIQHRHLAVAQAQRAEVLQQTTITLERLSAVGQEITAQLDRNVVFHALHRHVHTLMDADSLIVFLVEPDGNALTRAFGFENGNPIPSSSIAFSNRTADSIRCLRERREILIDIGIDDDAPNLIPGTVHTQTALFAPLMIGERLIGVLSAQAVRRFAFGERERLVFRTLCAYGAIALDNAQAYQKLQEAQQHMVGQEKLAALGALVAGVAHELNTPIGNCLMIAGAFADRTQTIRARVASPSLQRSELNEYLDDADEASTVILRGLSSAVELVKSFKQVAVDRTTAHRRMFDLAQTSQELVATMMNQIKVSSHSISLDIPPGIAMTSYPGPYGQVIANFINNAMLHAFDGRRGGKMHLSAQRCGDERVKIAFSDDGGGISEQNMRRIFEPFFTTKMGQGGSGLGLSISNNIVTSLLNGQLQCESALGQGTTFTLDLPLTAPQQSFWGG